MTPPPPDLGYIFKFLKKYPDRMFLFTDQLACLTYEKDVGQVLYLIGAFDRDRGQLYNTYVAQAAKGALNN